MISVLIPTWNNLDFLKLCVRSLRENSAYPHQIVLHVNDGSDGTLDWAKRNGIPFTQTDSNVGVCMALNSCAALARFDRVLFMNDDMYACPGWDTALLEAAATLRDDCYLLSSTVIQPLPSRSGCVIQADFGRDPATFRERELLEAYASLEKADWQGSTWSPVLVHRSYWNRVGGFSIELSPGLYSDPDFAVKMWRAGCRVYWGVSKSRVYHFESKTIQRVGPEVRKRCYRTFLRKWNLPAAAWDRYYVRMGEPFLGYLEEPRRPLRLRYERWKAKAVTLFGD